MQSHGFYYEFTLKPVAAAQCLACTTGSIPSEAAGSFFVRVRVGGGEQLTPTRKKNRFYSINTVYTTEKHFQVWENFSVAV